MLKSWYQVLQSRYHQTTGYSREDIGATPQTYKKRNLHGGGINFSTCLFPSTIISLNDFGTFVPYNFHSFVQCALIISSCFKAFVTILTGGQISALLFHRNLSLKFEYKRLLSYFTFNILGSSSIGGRFQCKDM